MTTLPDPEEQIRRVHASFIRQVVETCQGPERRPAFEQLVSAAEQQGWTDLARALRRIAGGDRSLGVLRGLDEEDRVIAESVLRGLQDPATLPDPSREQDPSLAAPGLAHMIHAARTSPEALMLVGNMADQMSRAGGGLARLAAVIRPLIDGERDPERLCRGMDAQGSQLVLDILRELGQLEAH
ncbi:MAG: hypothetical protein ACM3ST_08145 [Bdellovibrio bacteriovorus]